MQSDITDEEEVLDAFQWVSDNIENVDVLINCAEIIEPCSILGYCTSDNKHIGAL